MATNTQLRIARERLNEAIQVAEAYGECALKRWRKFSDARATYGTSARETIDSRKRHVAAVRQQDAAEAREAAAWKALHQLESELHGY